MNIGEKDFQDFKLLKEINSKFKLNIKDIDIEELNLKCKLLGNEILHFLTQIEFGELKKLNLVENGISDIKNLEFANFKRLEVLHLNSNKITNIDILEKANFKYLKALYFDYNKIKDIKVLEKVNIEKLKI